MRNRTTQNTEKAQAYKLTKLFADFANNLQTDAKRFNEEHKKTKERLENGTRFTKHQINL